MHADETDIHDFAGNGPDLDAVADAHAVFPNQKEVAGHGENHVLESEGHARGEKSGEGGESAQLGREGKRNNDDGGEPQDDPSDQEELIAAAEIGNVAEGRAAPDFRERHENQDNDAK